MQFFNALVDPDTSGALPAFDPVAHAVTDWTVLSFDYKHEEGDFAALSLEIKNPGTGLLAGSYWLWFSYQDDGDTSPTPLGLFRIVGIPSSILQDAVTVELVARPPDYEAQKQVVADAKRVLPGYDEVFIDPQQRGDNDAVLEAYSENWYVGPVTHVVDTSDVLTGEDGTETFSESEQIYDGFDFALGSEIPARTVYVDALMTWTQKGQGTVDIAGEILPSLTASYTFSAEDWPKQGTSLGQGWTVSASAAQGVGDPEVRHRNESGTTTVKWWDGRNFSMQWSTSDDYLASVPPGSINLSSIVISDNLDIKYDENDEIASYSHSSSRQDGYVARFAIDSATLLAAYDAARQCQEHVTFSMTADVQPIVTLPGDDEVVRLDNLKSVNLSDPIDATTGAEVPIGDPRRRSYVCTDRGRQSLEYLLLLARAHLLRRARAVDLTFAPTLDRLSSISLRKNATISDSRLPGGTATGKITSWRFGVVGDTGEVTFSVTMGCAVGNGGTVTAVGGTPVYISDDYIDPAYQEHTGQTLVINTDVEYGPPIFAANDDGLDFVNGISASDAFAQAVSVENDADEQATAINAALDAWNRTPRKVPSTGQQLSDQAQELITARDDAIKQALSDNETKVTFKLKSMRGQFVSEYPITVGELKVPAMIDLSA